MSEVTTYSFSFPSFIRDEFDKKFARLNKKLAKMPEGEEVRIVSEVFEDRKILTPEAHKEVQRTRLFPKAKRYIPTPEDYMDVIFTKVEVTVPAVNKHPGFEVVGTINIQKDQSGEVVKTIYALDDEVNLAEVDVKLCHHCGTRRERRALTVFNEVSTGELKAIGSTCVHEYLGIDIWPVLHTFFNFYKEDDFYGSRGMATAWGYPMANLANACRVAYVGNSNYVKVGDSRYGEYNEDNTKSRVDNIHTAMFYGNDNNKAEREYFEEVLKTAPKVGNLLMDFYGDLDPTKSNFNSNIVETLFYVSEDGERKLRDFVVGKSRGVFVWAVFNALNKTKEAEVKKSAGPAKPSNHVGTIGERIEVSGTVTFTKECDGYYGSSMMVKIQDKDGNNFVSFGTGNGMWSLKTGDEVKAKGTVSKHDEFKGVKQTSLKRLSVS
jgi:ribosomal protein L31